MLKPAPTTKDRRDDKRDKKDKSASGTPSAHGFDPPSLPPSPPSPALSGAESTLPSFPALSASELTRADCRTRLENENLETHLADPLGRDLFRRHILSEGEDPTLVDLFAEAQQIKSNSRGDGPELTAAAQGLFGRFLSPNAPFRVFIAPGMVRPCSSSSSSYRSGRLPRRIPQGQGLSGHGSHAPCGPPRRQNGKLLQRL